MSRLSWMKHRDENYKKHKLTEAQTNLIIKYLVDTRVFGQYAFTNRDKQMVEEFEIPKEFAKSTHQVRNRMIELLADDRGIEYQELDKEGKPVNDFEEYTKSIDATRNMMMYAATILE